jgi:predicted Abi (CAAX) family protease
MRYYCGYELNIINVVTLISQYNQESDNFDRPHETMILIDQESNNNSDFDRSRIQ